MYQDDQLEQPRKKSLVDALGGDAPDLGAPMGMPGSASNPNTGIAGVPDVTTINGPGLSAPSPSAPKAYDMGNMLGYDAGKMNDPNKQTAKYQMGRVLNGFDPRQGITPEVLAGLNGLGFGTFSSAGKDKMSLSGLTDKGKQAGLVGDYADADFITGFNTGNGKWGYQDPTYEAMYPESVPGAQPQGSGPSFAGSTISPMLQGNAQYSITAALQNVGGLAGSSRIQELIKALGAA